MDPRSVHLSSGQGIIFCSIDAHVKKAVSFASHCGFTVSVRSGGHNYAAYSSCPADEACIQVDLSGIETFSVDTTANPARVTLGAGLNLKQAYGQLVPYGITFPGGICSYVNIGGHLQSSGGGYLSRAFGFGIDHAKSFRMVLADGEVHTVDESSDPDLYWSTLGGSPGGFGIALDCTLDTVADADYPHAKTFTVGYPYSRAMLLALGSIFSSQANDSLVERDLGTFFFVHPGVLSGTNPTPDQEHVIWVRWLWVGIDNGELTSRCTKPMRSRGWTYRT